MISLQSAEFIAKLILLLAAYGFSATLTQAGQAWIAHLMGDDTAVDNGWLSLNPLAHTDMLSAVLVTFFGFGVVRNIPVDYRNFENHPFKLFIACMGQIIVSIFITIVAFLLLIIYFGHGGESIISDFQNHVPLNMIAQFYPEKSTFSIIGALFLIALIVYNLFIITFGFFVNLIDYYLIMRYKDGTIHIHNPSIFLSSWILAVLGVMFFGFAVRNFFLRGIIKSVSIICRLFGV